MGDLPPKLFFRIGEVAGLVGVEPHVLRYWEREFRSIRPTKSAKGQRVYSRKDVENLLRVRDLLYRDGFTIAGAKKRLSGVPASQIELEEESPSEPELDEAVAAAVTPATAVAGATEIAPMVAVAPAVAMETAPAPSATTREKLVALRREVEDFLAELSRR